MPALSRVTAEYVELEDRIQLRGEADSRQTVSLWLTQRLLSRLLPHLFSWLENKAERGLPSGVQQMFAQQAAVADAAPQTPVVCESSCQVGLISEVEIARVHQALSLTFKTAKGAGQDDFFTLTLQAKALRQWLSILYGQCNKADWDTLDWPDWVADAQAAMLDVSRGMLH
jgi:hypothetical protein